jgi:HAE1 family hydrophobic/amphiphilic exporter-1
MLGVFVVVLGATVKMFGIVPKGFIPDTDNDSLNVNIQAAQGTSYYEMVGYAEKITELIRQNPYVEAQMANVGGGGGGFGGGFNVQLTPRATRPLTAQQIAQQLRGPLGRFPGFRAFVRSAASGVTAPSTSTCKASTMTSCTHGRPGWRSRSPNCPRSRTFRTTWS